MLATLARAIKYVANKGSHSLVATSLLLSFLLLELREFARSRAILSWLFSGVLSASVFHFLYAFIYSMVTCMYANFDAD